MSTETHEHKNHNQGTFKEKPKQAPKHLAGQRNRVMPKGASQSTEKQGDGQGGDDKHIFKFS